MMLQKHNNDVYDKTVKQMHVFLVISNTYNNTNKGKLILIRYQYKNKVHVISSTTGKVVINFEIILLTRQPAGCGVWSGPPVRCNRGGERERGRGTEGGEDNWYSTSFQAAVSL